MRFQGSSFRRTAGVAFLGLGTILDGLTAASIVPDADEAELRQALQALGSPDPCTIELRLAWLRERAPDAASVTESVDRLPVGLRDGGDPPRATVELHGLRAEDALDRRVAELVASTLEDSCLRVVSAEEAASIIQTEADLLYLATTRPDDARAVLRRRLGDLVVVVSVSGASIAVDSVYGVATHLARCEVSATLLRVIDGRILGATSRISEVRRVHADAAVEAALQEAVGRVVGEVRTMAVREVLDAMEGIRLEVIDVDGDPQASERLLLSLRDAGVSTARRDGPGASSSIVVPAPHRGLSTSIEDAGWEVVDRRLGRWLLREPAGSEDAIRDATWIAIVAAIAGLLGLAWWRRRWRASMIVAVDGPSDPTGRVGG